MRILFLSKRRYMGKDLLSDRYGRFFELPEALALRGHAVVGLTVNYFGRSRDPQQEFVSPAGVSWRSVDLLPWLPQGLLRYRRLLADAIREFRPEVIVGASDAFHVILASRLGRRHGLPVVADLYDNFESYAATRAPGVRHQLRRAVQSVDAVTCVSRALQQDCESLRGPRGGVHLLPNAVASDLFHPQDRIACREALGLPRQATLIGTAGALTTSRDIETLYRAFELLAREIADLYLVVAGPRDLPPPSGPNVRDLGLLPHRQVPTLFAALDVGLVCNTASLFARYCDPQKLAEMRACGLPVVLADTFAGTVAPEPGALWLYSPGDATSLAAQTRAALEANLRPSPPAGTAWTDRATTLEFIIAEAVRSGQDRC